MSGKTSLYYASPKDISDLLMSSRKRVTKETLREIARERGIYLSAEETLDEIVEFVANLPTSWPELHQILAQTKSTARRPSSMTRELKGSFTREEVLAVVKAVEKQRTTSEGEAFTVRATAEGNIRMDLAYSEIDYSRTRLKQKREVDGELIVTMDATGLRIQHASRDREREVSDTIIDLLRKAKPAATEQSVSLRELDTAEKRTQFFVDLIKSVNGLILADVNRVDVDNRLDSDGLSDDEDEDSLDGGVATGVFRALLQGTSVLTSPQYQSLLKDGFYIWRVTWTAVESKKDGRLIELEARIGEPAAGTDFLYKVKGCHAKTPEGEWTVSRRPISDVDRRVIEANLIDAAWTSLSKARATGTGAAKP